jgi:hypothetical protein
LENESRPKMTDPEDKQAWRDFVHTAEVVLASAPASDPVPGRKPQAHAKERWADFAHTTDAVLASALAGSDEIEPVSIGAKVKRLWRQPRRVMFATGTLAASLLLFAGYLVQWLVADRQPISLQVGETQLELVNVSPASSIVSLRLTAPSHGLTRSLALSPPIPPTSSQRFRYIPPGVPQKSASCQIHVSAGYASGSESPVRDINFCRDNRLLMGERPKSMQKTLDEVFQDLGRAEKESRTSDFTKQLLEALALRADPFQPLTRLANSSDGRRVATIAEDGAAEVWDAATGHIISSLPGLRPHAMALAFTEDGKEIMTIEGDGRATIWSVESGREVELSQKPSTILEWYSTGRHVDLRAELPPTGDSSAPTHAPKFAPRHHQLPQGSRVLVLRIYGPWALVSSAGAFGYVATDDLTKTANSLGAALSPADMFALGRQIRELTEAGRYEEAATLCARYAEAIQAQYGEHTLEYAAALEQQAQLAKVRDLLREAESLYRHALRIREGKSASCRPDVVVTLRNLAQIYEAQRKHDLSHALGRRVEACKP